jgi:hypothetical protein
MYIANEHASRTKAGIKSIKKRNETQWQSACALLNTFHEDFEDFSYVCCSR